MSDTLQTEKNLSNIFAGFAFAGTNVALNCEAGNVPAAVAATITALTVLVASRFSSDPKLPLRINAAGMAVTAGVILGAEYLTAGTVSPDGALTAGIDLIFANGNRLAARPNNEEILADPSIRGVRKALIGLTQAA